MEVPLRCNGIKCRKELDQHAVVTTCCHIFCLDCSSKLQLSHPPEGQKPICPACSTHLVNPDDAVIANLNPTEDYKTSVLSGLSPSIIMECAGRALNFWAYQKTQEIVYQDHIVKSLTEKYTGLNGELDKVIYAANSEVSELRSKLERMNVDQDTLRRKNEELRNAYEDKSRKQLHTQEMYDKLKRQSMLGQVQNAASDAVEHHIEASVRGDRYDDRLGFQGERIQQPVFGGNHASAESGVRRHGEGLGFTTGARPDMNNSWNGNHGVIQNDQTATPSSHRQRLHSINIPNTSQGYTGNGFPGTPSIQRLTPRQPFTSTGTLNSPRISNNSGFGLSARARVSNPTVSAQGFHQPAASQPRARVAQRSVSANFMGSRPPAFGVNTSVNNFH